MSIKIIGSLMLTILAILFFFLKRFRDKEKKQNSIEIQEAESFLKNKK